MHSYQVINKSTHSNLTWCRYSLFKFAAQDTQVPLILRDLPKAALAFPLCFVKKGQDFHLVAILGIEAGKNLFVTADGRWMGNYVPLAYGNYPFRLGDSGDGNTVLCVDADSGLVGEGYPESFFDDQGLPSQSIKGVLSLLQQVRANHRLTLGLCALLDSEELIEIWPISINTENGVKHVEGVYRVNESKFNALGAEALHRLHQAGALPLIYCQLLSMQHLPVLGKLAQAHAKAKVQAQAQANAPLDFDQLLHASEALADAKPGKGKRGKGGQGTNGKGMNGHVADDLNWSL